MIHIYEELGDPSKRQIFAELTRGTKNVSQIVSATGLKQPNVSNHLARLRSKGILKATKSGREVYYTFADSRIESLVSSALSERRIVPSKLEMEEAAKRYAKAAIAGNEEACWDIVEHALNAQTCLIEIYQDLIAPAMKHVGAWYTVEAIDTAQEHMASSVTERTMARIVQVAGTTKLVDRTALLGCGPDSWHVIGLRMVADFLRVCGWKTLFLGANVPQPCFISTVSQNRPDLVLLSCKADDGIGGGIRLISALNDLRFGGVYFAIGVGGCCAAKHMQEFLDAGADFICADLRTFATEYLPTIERTGKAPRPL